MNGLIRSIRPIADQGPEVTSDLTALAECWGFDIEWDAPIGLRWEWHSGLLRIGPGFTPSDLVWLRGLALSRLLSQRWSTSLQTPVTVGGKS